MKEIDELNQRMDNNDEIIDNLVKKNTEMEKQVNKITENPIPDYSIAINTILTEVREIKQNVKQNEELTLLKQIYEKLSKAPTSAIKQLRILLFPETNQGQYYKIVFGRLIPWGICLIVITYLYSLGGKAIDAYVQYKQSEQSAHYQRAWIYLKQIAKRRTLSAMDTAYSKTVVK
ncbi:MULTISPECIES: hypothetical protein [unclassified Mucilaginibacter]|uniref:hypothetical protein n=1 Tax=unclassified Mucilaginibacter TaxID=2617802 RepID=UPI002AC8F527|nr:MULTISPECIES: hypothetical protein [unclassified Mucilaginibacter]MEB0280892.1 hypothetical protein [Mucilaginibacter sp. 10B2]MEB0303269.1 hypothetical protein [Mucilaginibacter sp. 5C4]WPX25635.1 hypothetical protein RHM67_10200 [Mucilaginibacter sp. 5C4]